MVYVKAHRRKGKRRVVAVRRHNRGKGRHSIVDKYQVALSDRARKSSKFYPKKTIINIPHQAVVFRDSSRNWCIQIGRKKLPDAFEYKQDAINYAEDYCSA